MTGEQLLTRLEKEQLLPSKVVVKLRDKLAAATTPVSAEKLAQKLVEAGQLTEVQVRGLLEGQGRVARSDGVDAEPVAVAVSDEDEAEDGEIVEDAGLVVVDDETTAESIDAFDDFDDGESPLGNLLDVPLTDEPDDLGTVGAPMTAKRKGWGLGSLLKRGPKKRAAKRRREKGRSKWDSPIIYVGGGVLAVFVIVAAGLLTYIYWDSGGKLLEHAEEEYRQGKFTQAIPHYREFLEGYPQHPKIGVAKVRIGMARIGQATSSSQDYVKALETAKENLATISKEGEFINNRGELGTLLPRIADGLAQQAQRVLQPDKEGKPQLAADGRPLAAYLVEQSEEAVNLVLNTEYVARRQRPEEQIRKIKNVLTVVQRELHRDAELRKALAGMAKATEAGNTREAFDIRNALLDAYPDLRSDPLLHAAVLKITEREVANVQVIEERIEPFVQDAPSNIVASLAIAHRSGKPIQGAARKNVFVRAEGGTYGVETATGKLLWQRGVGFAATREQQIASTVIRLPGKDGDPLLIDSRLDELVRVDGTSGRLQWRFPTRAEGEDESVDTALLPPLVLPTGILLPVRSGKLFWIDPKSGASTRRAVLPLGLRTRPTPHHVAPVVYLIGEHSSLYVLSTNDLSCKEVFYLGHEAGTIQVPPVMAMQYCVIAENSGVETSRLRLLSTNDQGGGLDDVQEVRLEGHVLTPPIAYGRRLIVMTDRGAVKVFEINGRAEGEPLTVIAERKANGDDPLVRYGKIENGRLWIADNRLARFGIQISVGRLAPQAIASPDVGDTFLEPLQLTGSVLLTVRRRSGRPGVTLAAVNTGTGERHWETDLAVPPAGSPIVRSRPLAISVVTATGAAFTFDKAAIQARVQDQPIYPGSSDGQALGRAARDLEGGRVAFASIDGNPEVLIYDPAASQNPVRRVNLPSAVTCAPVGFAGGLLAPLSSGELFLIDPATGKELAAPFHPRLTAEENPAWRTPGVVGDGKTECVVSDGNRRLYRLGIVEQPEPHLAALKTSEELLHPITSPVACLGPWAFGVDASGKLLSFDIESLQAGKAQEIGGSAIWGPHRVGNHVLFVTEREELVAINESQEVVWREPLRYGPLAGAPLVDQQSYVFSSQRGIVWSVAAATGQETAQVDLGEPLATGPVKFAGRLCLAGHDGTLYVTQLPAGD